MDLEKLALKLHSLCKDTQGVIDYIRDYQAMPLTLPVSDEPMRRISEVFTNNGFITGSSCEGHGKELPHLMFFCESPTKLNHLAHILQTESHEKNFNWEIFVQSTIRGINPESKLLYHLTPICSTSQINPAEDRERLLDDLDIIGIRVKKYFEEEKASEDEAEEIRKSKENLPTVADRIKQLNFSFMIVHYHDIGMAIKPKVEYFRDYEQDDYRLKGTIIEELKDGFIIATEEPVSEWETDNVWETPVSKMNINLPEGYTLNILVHNVGLAYFYPSKKKAKI